MKETTTPLSMLYELRRNAEGVGIQWTEEQERRLLDEEERIIRQEVLPLVTQSIEPALQPVERELVLVVEHVPGEPLKVSLSRKRNIRDVIDATPIEADPPAEHRKFGPQSRGKGDIAPATRLRVTMPDGRVIQEPTASATLAEAVRRIGPERIRPLGIKRCKVPFISNTLDGKYNQVPVGHGWYVITHSNTSDKHKVLQRIARELHIPLKVEIIA